MSARAARTGPSVSVREVAAALALLAAVAVFHVWSRTRVVTAGYALAELQKQHAQLQAQNDALHIELSMLTAPAALERALQTKLSRLGMALPLQGEVLAAGPRRPPGVVGRAGEDGVGDPSRAAGPALFQEPRRAPQRAAAAGSGPDPGPLALHDAGARAGGERPGPLVDAVDRGPLRAGRAPLRER